MTAEPIGPRWNSTLKEQNAHLVMFACKAVQTHLMKAEELLLADVQVGLQSTATCRKMQMAEKKE